MEKDKVNIFDILKLLYNNKVLLILCCIFGVLVAIVIKSINPDTYLANAVIKINNRLTDSSDKAFNIRNNDQDSVIPPSELGVVYLKSSFILDQVIQKLNLDIDVRPKLFPIIGRYFYNNYDDPISLRMPPLFLDLSGYSWGGETLSVSVFNVADDLIDKSFILKVIDKKYYQIYFDGNKILDGVVGNIEYNRTYNLEILVKDVKARPGTIFYIKKRSLPGLENELVKNIKISDPYKDSNSNDFRAIAVSGILDINYQSNDKNMAYRVVDSMISDLLNLQREEAFTELDKQMTFVDDQITDIESSIAEKGLELIKIGKKANLFNYDTQSRYLSDNLAKTNDTLMYAMTQQIDMSDYGENHPLSNAVDDRILILKQNHQRLSSEASKLSEAKVYADNLRAELDNEKSSLSQLKFRQRELLFQHDAYRGSWQAQIMTNSRVLVKPKPPLIMFVLCGILGGVALALMIIIFAILRRKTSNPYIFAKKYYAPLVTVMKSDKTIKTSKNILKMLISKVSVNYRNIQLLISFIFVNKNDKKVFTFFTVDDNDCSTILMVNLCHQLSLQKNKVLMLNILDSNEQINDNDNFYSLKNVTQFLDIVDIESSEYLNGHRVAEFKSIFDDYDFVVLDLKNIYNSPSRMQYLDAHQFSIMITTPQSNPDHVGNILEFMRINDFSITGFVHYYNKKIFIHDMYSK